MAVLFYRYNSICEPDYAAAFQTIGLEVREITEEMTNKEVTPAETVRLISEELMKGGIEFVFSINFYPAISAACELFHVLYLCQTVDGPVFELYSDELRNDCNRIFVFDRDQYRDFEPRNPGHVFHLPLATNTSRWDGVLSEVSAETIDKFSCDVSFVGSLYTEKNPYTEFLGTDDYLSGFLDGAMQAQLKVYGYHFLKEILPDRIVDEFKGKTSSFWHPSEKYEISDRDILVRNYMDAEISVRERREVMERLGERFSVKLFTRSDTTGLPVKNCGGCKTLTEMPVIFKHSKINLNITTKGIREGIPLRVFDVLGCGGFLITNYQAEIPNLFIPGQDLEVYGSMDELVEKVEYYLNHEEERQVIAKNGYEKVKENHNHLIRIAQMIEIAFGGE